MTAIASLDWNFPRRRPCAERGEEEVEDSTLYLFDRGRAAAAGLIDAQIIHRRHESRHRRRSLTELESKRERRSAKSTTADFGLDPPSWRVDEERERESK